MENSSTGTIIKVETIAQTSGKMKVPVFGMTNQNSIVRKLKMAIVIPTMRLGKVTASDFPNQICFMLTGVAIRDSMLRLALSTITE